MKCATANALRQQPTADQPADHVDAGTHRDRQPQHVVAVAAGETVLGVRQSDRSGVGCAAWRCTGMASGGGVTAGAVQTGLPSSCRCICTPTTTAKGARNPLVQQQMTAPTLISPEWPV
jgi:hypothetical protein